MSLDFNPQLKKYGVGLGGNFGSSKSNSGVSSQAKRNLGSSTSATKSSAYSLSGRRTSGFVAGQHVTKGSNKYNYENQRAALNSRTYTPSSSYSGVSASYGTFVNPYSSGTSKAANFFNSLNIGMPIGEQAYGFLNKLGVIGGSNNTVQNTSNSAALDSAMTSLTAGGSVSTTGSSGLISAMSNCDDSVSLRGALSNAKSELYNMQGMTSIYEGYATEAQNNMGTFKSNVDTAEKGVSTANQTLGTANQTVKATTENRDNCLNAVKKADSQYGTAVEKYTQAHDAHTTAKADYQTAQSTTSRAQSAFSQAEAKFNSTPEYIKDSNGNQVKNPQYEPAKRAKEEAEAQLNQAKQAEAQAKTKMEQAAQAETKAETDKTEAYKNLGDKKSEVDAAEGKLKTAQQQKDKAEEAKGQAEDGVLAAQERLQQATTARDSAESAVEKAKVHKKEVEKLEKAIKKQTSRLAKLEEKEQKEYNKYDKKAQDGIYINTERNNQIDYSDGVNTGKERRLSRKMEKTNDKTQQNIARRNAYSSSVDEKAFIDNALRNNPADFKDTGGSMYRKITTPSGQQLFYMNNQMISEEEYEKMQKQVQGTGT